MKEPTGTEIGKFWEWCGLKRGRRGINRGYYARPGDSRHTIPEWELYIDLNNLFEYAVPSIPWDVRFIQNPRGVELLDGEHTRVAVAQDEDYAIALFWAIWEGFNDI